MNEVNFSCSEDEIAALIDTIKSSKENVDTLTGMLPRTHQLYKDRGTNQVNRIRGYTMAAFEKTGLPEQALLYVCEELDNGHSPYLVAAAAVAIRGTTTPNIELTNFLVKALNRIAHKDEALSFSAYKPKWPLENFTSATQEILKTLAWLGANAKAAIPFLTDYSNGIIAPVTNVQQKIAIKAIEEIRKDTRKINTSCCSFSTSGYAKKKINFKKIRAILLQDQDGSVLKFGDFFTDSFSVVSFFYTRCDNPNKCSSTITKLAQLQSLLQKHGLINFKVAAITYDSAYDTPERLKQYSSNRGLEHDNQCKTFRILNDQENIIQEYFNSQVNYSNSIVNHHSIELSVLNKQGIIIKQYSGIELDNVSIVDFLKNSTRKRLTGWFKIPAIATNSVLPFLMLFFPKCPICWAGYLSLFGLSGIPWLKYNPQFYWLLVLLAAINTGFMYMQAKKSSYYLSLFIAVAGYLALFISIYINAPKIIKLIPIGLIIISSFTSVLHLRYKR